MTVDDLVPDTLWQAIQPLLPAPPPRYGGRPASTTARRWSASSTSCAPASLATPSDRPAWLWQPGHLLAATAGLAARRRVQHLHHLLLEELSRQGRLDWSRASLDSMSVRAKRGAV